MDQERLKKAQRQLLDEAEYVGDVRDLYPPVFSRDALIVIDTSRGLRGDSKS